jgi:hypothetical protein
MSKSADWLKYVGAVVVFGISYVICSGIMHVLVRLVNINERGFWTIIIPYFASFMAGLLGVYSGLFAIDRLFPTVRPRTIAWVFIVPIGIIWGLPLLGLLASVTGLIDLSLQNHIFWSADTLSQAVQTLTAVIAFWKFTAAGGEWE